MKFSLEGKLATLLFASLTLGAVSSAVLAEMFGAAFLAAVLVVVASVAPIVLLARRALLPLRKFLRAMNGAVANYRDGEFSVSLVVDRDDELGKLVAAHNDLGQALRDQRSHLVQRELLLETVTQNSPVGLLLVDTYQHVVYANPAAQLIFNCQTSLLGEDLSDLVKSLPEPLRAAIERDGDQLIAAEIGGIEEIFHISQRSFSLQGRHHRLYLLKSLTRELSRQEVVAWKKLFRILSHELNNSLAPIASMAQTGREVVRRGMTADLGGVFETIGERAEHLHRFIDGYARFAKLPVPRPQEVDWTAMVRELARQQPFRIDGVLPRDPGWFDRSQLEQALINLLKNAHESDGPISDVELSIRHVRSEQWIEVRDRGTGMNEVVLTQALLPFYSTKRSGTGLGLALAREIVEAHGGRIQLANREGGGLCVGLVLPLRGGQPLS